MKRNVKQRLYTHEGAPAKHITLYQQLRRSVLSCMLFEKEFYEDGQDIAERIYRTAHGCKASEVAVLATEARSKYKLRHAPLMLLKALVSHPHVPKRNIIGRTIADTIQRPDELTEFVALYFDGKRKPLSAQMKKGLGLAFRKFDEYQLAKYNWDGAVKLRDVLFLCHAKPKDKTQEDVWKRLIDGKLKTPNTWEVSLSSGEDKKETFERLIREKKLGYMALLRNLRNMKNAGVSKSFVEQPLIEGAKKSKALPFRFVSAAVSVPAWEDIIEQALFNCLGNKERLRGHTAIIVDCSDSMGAKLSSKSILSRFDAAASLAIIVREIADKVSVIAYGTDLKLVQPRRGFALRDVLNHANVGWGTDLRKVISACNAAHDSDLKIDRSIVITDEQTRTDVPDPNHKSYVINVASARNGVGYGSFVHIDGFSEATIDYIQELEAEHE